MNKRVKNPEIEKIKREAERFYLNAKETLKRAKPDYETGIYDDIKYVQEAFGTLWLAVLKALDYRLLTLGVNPEKLPKNKKEYDLLINRKLRPYNGKVKKHFDSLWKGVHIAGYYRGVLDNIKVVKDYFQAAKNFIDYLLTLKRDKFLKGG